MKAVDLFAGWGGFTLAAERAGCEVVWAANHWPVAVETHAANHPHVEHSCQDLRQADWTSLPHFELLLASPACQGHSTASQPKRRLYHDAMRATAWAVVDCADVTQPRSLVVENVPAFRQWRLYPMWRAALRRIGYRLTELEVTASHHGVPQRRRRLFVVGTLGPGAGRVVLERETPDEVPFAPCIDTSVSEGWRSIVEATPRVQERIAKGRARGLGYRFLTQNVTAHPGVGLDEPIRTITTAPQHWALVEGDRYRYLTGRELARGMGFPDTYHWNPALSIEQVTQGLGNAVCPGAGEAVIRAAMFAALN